MQPRQIRETSRPVEPSFTYCIVAAPAFGGWVRRGAYGVVRIPCHTRLRQARDGPDRCGASGGHHTCGEPGSPGPARPVLLQWVLREDSSQQLQTAPTTG